MTVELAIFPTPQATADALAASIITTLAELLSSQPLAHLVLTGGTMGIKTLESVAASPEAAGLEWDRVHVWWGDERWVSSDSADRNDKQAAEALLSKIPLAAKNVHRPPSTEWGDNLDAAALAYGEEMYQFGGKPKTTPEFDILLLGVGPDGHVASLFPGLAQVYDKEQGAVPVYDSPKPPSERISMTLPTINRAKRVWFVAAGTDKATAVHLALRGLWFVDLPASGAKGTLETRWFVDEDAASELDDELKSEYDE